MQSGKIKVIKGSLVQNGLVKETNVTLLAKGVEFEVEPQEDHAFEVEPQGNVDHATLKEDMDARSDVYVLSNSHRKSSDDRNDYYWEYTPGMFIHLFLYIDDMVFLVDARLRSWLPRVCWIKQKEMYLTLLEGHSILSLEGSLSGDCDVEKNGKRSCIYAVGIQEYQVACTRPDIAYADVAAYKTLTEAAKEAIWLKGLAIESGFELKIVAGIATEYALFASICLNLLCLPESAHVSVCIRPSEYTLRLPLL
nr:reverse transcriptase [Tanacetum cinerariifolium]